MQLSASALGALLEQGYVITFSHASTGDGFLMDVTCEPRQIEESVSARLLEELFGDVHNRARPEHGLADGAARMAALEQRVSGIVHRMNWLFDQLMARTGEQAAPESAPLAELRPAPRFTPHPVSGPVAGLMPGGWPPVAAAAVAAVAAVAEPVADDVCTDFIRAADGVGACARCGQGPEYHATGVTAGAQPGMEPLW